MGKFLRTKHFAFIKYIAWVPILVMTYFAPAYIYAASQVQTSGAGLVSKIAPGEFLPLSVKLLNFGNNNRVDVILIYKIVDAQSNIIFTDQETVAVETTASFIKTIQIPGGTKPGQYTASSSIIYQGQATPATSEFSFTVERKIFGIFQSEFYLFAGIVLLISIIVGFVSRRILIARRRTTRLTLIDYSDIPTDTRVFYELISDTILGMRQQIGQQALDIVKHIDGIVFDEKTGRVIKITNKPSKVIAELVSEYEKSFGKKVSFSLRRP